MIRIGPGNTDPTIDRDQLRQAIADHRQDSSELWLVLLGHGTFDGRTARFNLEGPDVSATDVAGWLQSIACRAVVVNCSSASGPFINRLSGANRVIVTATKSGHERNFARFGGYLSEAISDPSADLDKDNSTSLLEAWLMASRSTRTFYENEGRLATEHALLDDNEDGFGSRSEDIRGIQPVGEDGGEQPDGRTAHQVHLMPGERDQGIPEELRKRRDELELDVARLRQRRNALTEDEYYSTLEILLIELATLNEAADVPIKNADPSTGSGRAIHQEL